MKLLVATTFLAIGLFFLVGCTRTCPHVHKFQKGQIVEVIIDDRKGQVVGLYKYHGTVMVRVPAHTVSTRALGGTIDGSPYATVDFSEYEIRAVDEPAHYPTR